MAMRQRKETPAALVENGRFHFGTFATPFRVVNPLDARIYEPLPLPRALKDLRLKEWQHFAFANDEYFISLALFNAKLLGLAQVCVYGRRDRSIRFYEKKTPPWAMSLPATLWDAHASYRSPDFTLLVHNELDRSLHSITFDIAGKGELPAVAGSFTVYEDLERIEPIEVCLPLGRGRALYTHKCVAPCEGTLTLGGNELRFERSSSYSLVDAHKGFYPFVMKWHWATAARHDKAGKLSGFNLTNNQVEEQEHFNENCFWQGGRIELLPPVTFSFNENDYLRSWKIRDAQGRIDLTFSPEALRTVDVNALLIRSRYRSPYGLFNGRITTESGEALVVEDYFGMCEDFYLRV
jgi:hypothetical protein